MKRVAAAVLICFAAAPALAREPMPLFNRPQPPESGIIVGVRGGYGIPFGDAQAEVGLDEVLDSTFPAWVEVGARRGRLFFGLYYQYALAKEAACDPGDSCSGWMMRAGAELLYTLAPEKQVSPWLGVGMGWVGIQLKNGGGTTRADAFEFANLQYGIDWKVTPAFVVGPYGTVSFARFGSVDGAPIEERATHSWLQLGLRSELRF
jgi:hypothetical protein